MNDEQRADAICSERGHTVIAEHRTGSLELNRIVCQRCGRVWSPSAANATAARADTEMFLRAGTEICEPSCPSLFITTDEELTDLVEMPEARQRPKAAEYEPHLLGP